MAYDLGLCADELHRIARLGMNYCHPSYRSGWSFRPCGPGQFLTRRGRGTHSDGTSVPGAPAFSVTDQHLPLCQ